MQRCPTQQIEAFHRDDYTLFKEPVFAPARFADLNTMHFRGDRHLPSAEEYRLAGAHVRERAAKEGFSL